MQTQWTDLARRAGFAADGPKIEVALAGPKQERRQFVRVDQHADDELRIWSTILPRGAAETTLDARFPDLWVWRQNHATDMVGLRIDSKGRLVGEAFVPMAGLTAEEFGFIVRRVAEVCDRLEYTLTGGDRW